MNAGDTIEILKKRLQSKKKETKPKSKKKTFEASTVQPTRYFESNSTIDQQEPSLMTKKKCVSFDLTSDP